MPSHIRVQCPCGKTLRVPVHLRGKRVECPACGAANPVPRELPAQAEAPTAQPALWLKVGGISLLGFLGLLLIGGVIIVIVKLNEPRPPDLGQTPNGELPPAGPTKLEVVFDRFDPPEPQEGKAVTVFLKGVSEGAHGPLVFQYRQDSTEAWQPAADGHFSIENLKAGPLTLQARVLDA